MTGATRRRAGLLSLLVLCAVAALAGPASAGEATPEAQLAERYAPVVRVATDLGDCTDGAPFVPIDVDTLFANPEVVLRGPWDRVNVAAVAPTVDDLAPGRVDYHLDFPGDALSPGCTYLDWQQRLDATAPPTAYAHVVTDPGHPGKLALQYWFFYVYNHFNNLHEGDWEMIQLDFDAASAADALATQPTEVGYSQHEGAERAGWDDSKLERIDGTHPVVYPAEGSHANFYEPALFLGRSAAQGVGCDDTTGPHEDLRPRISVIPTDAAAARRDYPWLAFDGRWGELRPAFYNGPTGPNLKRQWTEPIEWASEWRASSFAVPAGSSIGPKATDFFCGAVAAGSSVVTRAVRNPLPSGLAIAALLAVVLYAGSRTTWSPDAPLRLVRRRALGQIVRAAWRMYRARFGLFAGIGLLFVPLSVVITLLQYLLFRVVGLVPLVETAGASNVSVAGLAFSLGLLFTVLGMSFVQAATAAALSSVDDGVPVTARAAYRLALARLRPLLASVLLATVVVTLLDLTIVGIPVAIWLVVRWSLLAQVVMLDERESPGPLRRSAALVRGRWWRVAVFTTLVTGSGLLLGPVIGGLLLLATDAAFNVVNLIAGLVYTVTMPFVALASTYLYADLSVRSSLAVRAAGAGDVLAAEL